VKTTRPDGEQGLNPSQEIRAGGDVTLRLTGEDLDRLADLVANRLAHRFRGSATRITAVGTTSELAPDEGAAQTALAQRIAAYLSRRPCAPQGDVERAARARAADVRRALRDLPRFAHVSQCRSEPRHHPNSKCWALVGGVVPGLGTAEDATVEEELGGDSILGIGPGTGHEGVPA